MSRARGTESAFAALAVLIASWPITTLLIGGQWVRPVPVLVLVQMALGMGGRALGLGRTLVACVQVAAVLLGTLALHLGDHLAPGRWADLPGAIGDLFAGAADTLSQYAAPAPATPGVVFALTLIVPLIGVLVDVLAVSLRMPAVAGLPLLALFLLSTSNTGSALNPVYFVALAAAWLLMLARGGLQLMRRWSSAEAYARQPERIEDRLGLAGYSSVARGIGIATVALAVVLPAFIPHLPPRYISDGLARSTSGNGSGVGSVGFSDRLDLTQNLRSRNQDPVLSYTTNDPEPPPLRALSMSLYSGGDWVHDDPPRERPGANQERLPAPEGLGAQPQTLYRSQVTANGVDSPYVAVPWPVTSADFGGTAWTYEPGAAMPRVSERPDRYTITYTTLRANARPTSPRAGDAGVAPATLAVDPSSSERVRTTTADVVRPGDSDFTKAVKIQDWLRDPSRFTYSLTLKPTQTVDGQRLDPISNFLQTRQGYCTQFATAMVMMARSQGIPARLAVGFLSGVAEGATYEVRQSDAHAWPELYFPGLGWTRFEPTPGVRSGTVPAYATPSTDAGSTGAGREEDEPTDTATSTAPTTSAVAPTTTQAAPPAAPEKSVLQDSRLWWTLLVLVAGAMGAVVLPLAARWRRDQPLRTASDPREQVEGEWQALQSRLDDLGVQAPHGRTPRQIEQHYRHQATLGGEGRAALHRAVRTLEAARYAPPSDETRTLHGDADRILREVRSNASWPTRTSAALTPRTGRRVVADLVRRAVGAPGAWWDRRRGD
ncbi:transglutaminase family protein [Luteipulveratus halotolerans]|uniref:Transglutaminase-like domain-containing protein n=1 Tax=Luteipulveratus halotolerans TaxID=1631356 RepID=A0A0L6CH08_9MICO|nr:DUF3488 and transglutaminase-like domain-containing protein [Luteipulveratus halotolerans]KNX36880.1 hypothetical protein VV01_06515 [Luteipulveratus halotolerans]